MADDEEDEDEQLVDVGPQFDQGLEKFHLPYKVATVQEGFNQRAYWDQDAQGEPEWLWGRAHDYMKIQLAPSKFLLNNKDTFASEFEACEVPAQEFHFRKKAEKDDRKKNNRWVEHTMESRGFLIALMWCMKNRALALESKKKALALLKGLIASSLAFAAAAGPVAMSLSVPDEGGLIHQALLTFSGQGITHEWAGVVSKYGPATALWHKLHKANWLGSCLCSSLGATTMGDIIFFLCYISAHPLLKVSGQNVLQGFGRLALKGFIWQTGVWLADYARHLCTLNIQSLPLMRSKSGNIRKTLDPVNRMILLHKLRKEKVHRMRVASTHGELVPEQSAMMKYESYIECALYQKSMQETFGGQKQVSVAWDPSNYGGKDVLVSIIYSSSLRRAGYLMNQQLTKVRVGDVHESLLPLVKQRKLTRIEGYNELRGLSHSLSLIGLTLMDFAVPEGLILRPLLKQELLLPQPNGRPLVHNTVTQLTYPMVPPALQLSQLPLLVSISDQGPVNVPALNYLMYSEESLLVTSQWDCYHRTWNDLKLAGKRAAGGVWKTILRLSLLFNVNYGPYGSGGWFAKKRSCLEEFLLQNNSDSYCFANYASVIARERRIREPQHEQDCEALFETLKHLQNFNTKGPLVKLMRWFSWFETACWWEGEYFATRMILEEMGAKTEGKEEAAELPNEEDPQKELRELKKKQGTWKLAPQMVTNTTMCVKDIVLTVGKAAWKHHAARAREVTSAADVLLFNIQAAGHKGWAEELVSMVHDSLWNQELLLHLQEDYCLHEQALEWHMDFFDKLLETRSMSLTSFHTLPPNRYHHSLSRERVVAQAAHDMAMQDFQALLTAEEADVESPNLKVEALALMAWTKNPVCRALYLSYLEDDCKRLVGTPQAAGPALQRVMAETLGDSKMVENAHQFGKDLLRSSRHKTFGNVRIWSNTLNSQALERRGSPVVTFHKFEKATGPLPPQDERVHLAKSLKATQHHLPKAIQNLMVPISGKNRWPSPNPASLFASVAATEWVFKFFGEGREVDPGTTANDAWLSILAQPGHFLVQQSQHTLWKVMARAEYGFLAWQAHIEVSDGQRIYLLEASPSCIQWRHIVDLSDWLQVPVKPTMMYENVGPLGWVASGNPLPLDVAVVQAAISLTVKQMRSLLKLYNVKVAGNASRATVEKMLVETVLQDEAMRQEAFKKFKAKTKTKDDDDDLDSELSEVISELAQDEFNQQDLKEYKQKKKVTRLKRKLSSKEPLEDKKPKRRAKAKAKAAASNKRKAPSYFIHGVLKRRKQRAGADELVDATKEALADKNAVVEAGNVEAMSSTPAKNEVEAPLAPEGSGPASSSGSKGPAPAEPASLVMYDKALTKTPTTKKASTPVPGQKKEREPKRKSPEEVLSLMTPPRCQIGISFTDHRFTSKMAFESKEFTGRMKQQTFTVSFAQRLSWDQALKRVHEYNWRKWHMVKEQLPLPAGQEPQTPGEVPQHVMEQLKPTIDALPPLQKDKSKAKP